MRQLAGEELSRLANTDELESLNLHLDSMRNFSELKNVPRQRKRPSGNSVREWKLKRLEFPHRLGHRR